MRSETTTPSQEGTTQASRLIEWGLPGPASPTQAARGQLGRSMRAESTGGGAAGGEAKRSRTETGACSSEPANAMAGLAA